MIIWIDFTEIERIVGTLVFNSVGAILYIYCLRHLPVNLVGVTYFLSLQGFMEDEGRQRTTKFISHKSVFMHISKVFLRSCSVDMSSLCLRCASGSDQLQLFVKEQERNKLLCSSDPPLASNLPSASATSSTSGSAVKDNGKTPRRKQTAGKRGRSKDVEEDALVSTEDAADKGFDKDVKSGRKSRAKRNASEKGNTEESPPENPVTQPPPGERGYSLHTPKADFY